MTMMTTTTRMTRSAPAGVAAGSDGPDADVQSTACAANVEVVAAVEAAGRCPRGWSPLGSPPWCAARKTATGR